MSMTISCTWAGQSTDQTTLAICMSVVYDYQVTDMDGRGMCGVAETPGMWETFDCSSGTLGTVNGGGWGKFVA